MSGGASGAEARLTLRLDSNAGQVSADEARALDDLRRKISGGNDTIKQMQAALRSLRGSTDVVTKAKAELKSKIDAEKNSVSAANLKLLQMGTTYEKVAADARKLAKEQSSTSKMTEAIRLAGGPVQDLSSKFEGLQSVVMGEGAAMGAATVAVAAGVAAIMALDAAIVVAAAGLIKFIALSADTERSLNLTREAVSGTALNARNLGSQVDLLASKVPTAKGALNDLAVSLMRTRLSGGAIVDTLNLVGQASSAMGDEVGNALRDIVTRGQMWNRFQLNPLELQGKGVRFNDVAAQLAKNLRIGVNDARAALFEGRVKLDDGAKALRQVVEKNFGDINARKMISLSQAADTLQKRFALLTRDVHLDVLLDGLEELSKLFDQSTVTGAALKQLVTFIGNGIGPAFMLVLPLAKGFFEGIVIGALQVGIAFLQVRNYIRDTFGGDNTSTILTWENAVRLGEIAVWGMVGAVGLLAAGVALATVPFWGSAVALYGLYRAGKWVYDAVAGIEWAKLGSSIIDGLIGGLRSAWGRLTGEISKLADAVKLAFTAPLQIHSPSRVFYGHAREDIAGAVALGLRAGTPAVENAAAAMAPMPQVGSAVAPIASAAAGSSAASSGRGGVAGSGPVVVKFEFHGVSSETAKQITQPSILALVASTIEDALHGAGVQTQTVPVT